MGRDPHGREMDVGKDVPGGATVKLPLEGAAGMSGDKDRDQARTGNCNPGRRNSVCKDTALQKSLACF